MLWYYWLGGGDLSEVGIVVFSVVVVCWGLCYVVFGGCFLDFVLGLYWWGGSCGLKLY